KLEFKEGTLAGRVNCTPKSPKLQPVSVEGSTNLQTDALDQAAGKFTVEAFSMEKTVGEFYCQGGLRAGTYDFKIVDLKLTLTLPNVSEPIIYTKIGDQIE